MRINFTIIITYCESRSKKSQKIKIKGKVPSEWLIKCNLDLSLSNFIKYIPWFKVSTIEPKKYLSIG